jgi:hypothetical protein
MYKKKNLISEIDSWDTVSDLNPFADRVAIARPLSYYIDGGVDLDGISNRKPLPAAFDDAESIASGDVNVFTDATVSKLDLMDMASVVASESQARALKDGANEPNSD